MPTGLQPGAARIFDDLIFDKMTTILKVQKHMPPRNTEEYGLIKQRFHLPISRGVSSCGLMNL
jgi:hypothetical protein